MQIPEFADLKDRAVVLSIPLRVKFRGITSRETMLLHGPAGWAEFGPFLEYDDAESSRWLTAALEAGWEGFPAPVRSLIPINATVPAVDAAQVPAILERFGAVPAVKVKVAEQGQSISQDVARVAMVRKMLPDAGLRVDANAGWDEPTAIQALSQLAEFNLEYAEQPVPSIEGLATVRQQLADRGIPVRIAADESVRKEEDPLKVARAGAADLIVVKVQPLSGVRRAASIVAQAGLPAVVSSALDTSVGISAGLALAAHLPELPFACGLGTVNFFTKDVIAEPLVPRDGCIQAQQVQPEPERLERLAASPERTEWWMNRLARCAEVLRAQ